MPVKQSTEKQYAAIRKEYEKLSNVKQYGVQKYHPKWIFHKVADDYFKSPATIEAIVFYRVP